jgi:hypothetical protein
MNNKVALIISVVLLCALGAAMFATPYLTQTQQPTKEIDFTVSASSDCLRFLNSSVPVFYVPFTVTTNQNMKLTINCTKMPGGANGWTDVYLYKGYWNGGSNHTCVSGDLYPILKDIQRVDFAIRLNTAYVQTFGHTGSGQDSYTVFFVVPPGGQPATFHVTLKQV